MTQTFFPTLQTTKTDFAKALVTAINCMIEFHFEPLDCSIEISSYDEGYFNRAKELILELGFTLEDTRV